MTDPSGNHHDLSASINMGGLLAGSAVGHQHHHHHHHPAQSAGPGDAMSAMGHDLQPLQQQGGGPRIVSAASSVVSANSLSSSSTKGASSIAHGAAPGSGTIRNLMKQLSAGQGVVGDGVGQLQVQQAQVVAPHEEKKENEVENRVPQSALVPQAVKEADSGSSSTGNNPMVMPMGAPPHPVAEFLFQLTKMLTDNNSEYIEWRNASIFVHDPPGLEKDILPKYFRHSNYSSFQRQMNYFGFRKIAGKGKMAPCSYVNEHAKEDISSLLFIKRKKTGVSSAAAKLMAQQNRINRTMAVGGMGMPGMAVGNPGLMMGGALGGMGAHHQGLNNYGVMGGVPAGAAAQNMMAASAGSLEQANLLREQQNMLAQLQQAHASALSGSSMGMGGGAAASQGGMAHQAAQQAAAHQAAAAQNKLGGLGSMGQSGSSANTSLLTNDQGSVYIGANTPSNDWGNQTSAADAAAAQSLFLQQQGLGGSNFPQGMGGATDANGVLRVDSAANLRALINQQISMFNTGGGDPFGGALAPMPAAAAGMMVQPQATAASQQVAQQANQGYEWNDLLRQSNAAGGMGNAAGSPGMGGVAGATASLRQLEQQLLQQSQAGAPGGGVAATPMMGQSYGLNGFFNQGAGGPQNC